MPTLAMNGVAWSLTAQVQPFAVDEMADVNDLELRCRASVEVC